MLRTRGCRLITLLLAFHVVSCLWPMPRSLTNGSDFLRLSSGFSFSVSIAEAPADLLEAIDRTSSALQSTLIERLVVGRGAADSDTINNAPTLSSLEVSLTGNLPVRPVSEEAVLPLEERQESYSLLVPSDGSAASLVANSTLGILRGLATFEQMWYVLDETAYTNIVPLSIEGDAPAYPYRGFMLDTARNFFPVSDIKRTLDAMSFVKMSTLHWHVVDSQSFPLEVAEYPELSEMGAYSSSQVYSMTDVNDIVSYAAKRGIDVLMEIDVPGHTDIISLAHPSFIACSEASPWQKFAAEPPSGQLRLTSRAVIDFTTGLLGAVARRLPSAYFSTGGDEVNTACYMGDLQTQADLAASGMTLEEALDVFVHATQDALADEGKAPVVWEEMVLAHNLTLSKETVVMVWISSEHAAEIVKRDFRIVQAPSDYFYLDCGGGQWLGNDPSGTSWCDPYKTWQKAYTFNPLADLTPDQHPLVLGGQQCLWAEQASPENLDSIVWPRAASSAEVFWTGSTGPDGRPLDVNEALPRMHDVRYRLVKKGVRAIALQPEWCAVRPFQCNINA
ncbi:N-acetylhexosaminidase [Schizophyllum amplum]|uniref:Beta-hexosaminidase n=1 Tax=Schizophyllum amplum TaxID=97359 RepID=A0A550CBF9_9AGAR|nr:N-acetylhexosaminidase [Auriculariopsis ampla]